jgi:phosphatidylinositol 3-kinase
LLTARLIGLQELLLYLLQLVQALKFEPKSSSSSGSSGRSHKPHRTASSKLKPPEEQDSGLADFLISRSVNNAVLGTAFHWYLMVECEDRVVGKMYAKVAFQFMTKLVEVSRLLVSARCRLPNAVWNTQTEEGTSRREVLRRQGELVATLSQRAKELRTSKDARPKKIDKLRAFILDSKNGLSPLPSPLTLPLNPRIEVTGIAAERSSVFKSNLFPLLLWFQCNSESGEYPIIFKNGDDLRQDQLVIQLFTLMDRLLRKENLDLKLSPYAVLATGPAEGMIQFVPSKSLAVIMGEYGSLLNYLKVDHADEGAIGSLGIEPAVLDTFIRSCGESKVTTSKRHAIAYKLSIQAGYSVVTYVLGVGDRHLDNLMLAPDGKPSGAYKPALRVAHHDSFPGHFFHGAHFTLGLGAPQCAD